MPELNQAIITRWAIICLQYFFLLCIYYFIYQTGQWIYRDLARVTNSSSGDNAENMLTGHPAYITVLAADESSGLLPGTRFDLQETTTIGRNGEHNTIMIQESFVSAEHALIQSYNNQYWISDLSSTNGTIVNAGRIEDETLLHTGDQIKIGSVILRFER